MLLGEAKRTALHLTGPTENLDSPFAQPVNDIRQRYQTAAK
jgi:hypothetical protein